MAKNITIREGDTSKQFTAKKLKTNLVGGGTCNWIPEDEAIDYVKLVDKEFKANGTYNPGDFNADGFGQVKVNIPSEVKPKTITANGEFYAADDGCLGYSKVTVAVPTGGGGGPFTVRFFDDDRQTIIKTEANVPYGGSASCTDLDGTVLGGLYFKGWNPSPTNVKGDMNCYPVRGDYYIGGDEIEDSWETICANGGVPYDLGSYKALVFDVTPIAKGARLAIDNPYGLSVNGEKYYIKAGTDINENVPFFSVAMHMVKVAEGEDNSDSTWLSTGCISIGSGCLGTPIGVETEAHPNIGIGNWGSFSSLKNGSKNASYGNPSPGILRRDWAISGVKYVLDNYLFPSLPTPLKAGIVAVNKSYMGYSAYGGNISVVEKTSLDKIWVPSKKELYTKVKNYQRSNVNDIYESHGIDYTLVYMPTYTTNGYVLRTLTGNTGVNYGHLVSVSNDNYFYANVNYTYCNCPIGFCLKATQ